MVKVSVIIPVYGVEKYIERCVIALFKQTLDEIEYIFIDDCTPDNSIRIVQKVLLNFPNRKKQVVIHKMEHNSGQAKVREWGIKNAKGEYIASCDSDDWISEDMYERMYNKAIEDHSDVVFCDYNLVKDEGIVIKKGFVLNAHCHNDIVEKMFSQDIPYCLWNKLIRKSLFLESDLIFPSKSHGEDMALCLQIIAVAPKISYIEQPFYYYRYDSNTLYHNESEKSILKKFYAVVENVSIVENYYRKKNLEARFSKSIMYIKLTSRDKLLPLLSLDKYYRLWKHTFSEINYKLLFNNKIKIVHKVKFLLVYTKLHLFNE